MKLPAFAEKARRLTGIDRAVGFAILGRGWSALAGIITLALLVRFLTKYEQAYYSTFGNFMALQVFFELGLSMVLMQFASHERAGLEWTPQRTLEGDPIAKARLASLLRRGLFWYALMSVAALALIYPAGFIFFHSYNVQHPGEPPVAWQTPWLLLALSVSTGLLFTPLWAILEGSGLVAEVVAAQFVGGVLNSLLFWVMLSHHWGLYAAPIGGLAGMAWTITWLSVRQRGFLMDLLAAARPGIGVSWRTELWPLQWKIALSWLSGFFIFELFVPLLLWFHGLVAAGRLGLSLSIVLAIAAIAMGWVSTKAAPFGSLVARKEWAQMDKIFFPCLLQSTVVLVVGEAAFWLLRLYLPVLSPRLDGRLLGPLPLGMMMAAMAAAHIVGAEAVYLRAHKQEPLLIPALAGGLCICVSSFFLGRAYGATGMMAGYLVISLIFGTGLGTLVFIRKRREWHRDLHAGSRGLSDERMRPETTK